MVNVGGRKELLLSLRWTDHELLGLQQETERVEYLLHDRKDPGLVIVVAVGSNTEIDLLVKSISLVRSSQLEDAEGTG